MKDLQVGQFVRIKDAKLEGKCEPPRKKRRIVMNKKEILGTFSLVNNPIVLSEEEIKDVQKAIEDLEKQVKKQKEVIDKAIDKLYCWGEALNPDFQKEMLDILKEWVK